MTTLSLKELRPDPIEQFALWYKQVLSDPGILQPTAMALATIGTDAFPNNRMVLLKEFDARGFVFYTNLTSTKGKELKANPRVALTFYWEKLDRQVRVQGDIEFVSDTEADRYFASRPRLSQIGAWASHQSATLDDRALLDQAIADFSKRYEGQPIPRPPYWTGARVKPRKIEFWQARDNRLHDRFVYERAASEAWTIKRLYP